uniref:Uncharacterized protein n=1 Tax=Anopheles atroparvus TaxID=41427 RepID=A0AAG5DHP5_ANOAO
MGCSSSVVLEEETPHTNTPVVVVPVDTWTQQTLGPAQPETVAAAYRRMDEEICALESTTPGPRLTTAEGWVELLRSANVQREGEQDPGVAAVPNGAPVDFTKSQPATIGRDRVTEDARQEMQEEFVARLSRAAMDQESEQFRVEMIEHGRKRALFLQASFDQLKRMYIEQDQLLAMVYNGTYGSPTEQKLDGELDAARDVRDRLGGAVEQWRIAGGLLRAAAKGLHQTIDNWELLRSSRDAEETVRLALDARTACLGALVALEAAQAALPQVEIPYITIRQQAAVRHALIYLLTDMVNPARYQHTRDVFGVFGANVTKAVHWLHECYDETLRQDYGTADQAATLLAKTLREERLRFIAGRVPNKLYVRPAIGK